MALTPAQLTAGSNCSSWTPKKGAGGAGQFSAVPGHPNLQAISLLEETEPHSNKSRLFFYLSADLGSSSDVPAPPGVLRRDPPAHFWLAQVGTPSLGSSHWVNTM